MSIMRIVVLLLVGLVLGTAHPAHAQARSLHGFVALGPVGQEGTDIGGYQSWGLNIRVGAGRALNPHLAATAELSGSWFPGSDVPMACDVVCPRTGRGSSQAAFASLIWRELEAGAGLYLLGGVGARRFQDHPALAGNVYGAVQVGLGLEIPLIASSALQIDVRYDRSMGMADGPRWQTPITMGLRL